MIFEIIRAYYKRVVFWFLLGPAVVYIIFSYGSRVYAFCWHLIYKNPVHWEELLIAVPKTFVVDLIERKPSGFILTIRNVNFLNPSTMNFHKFDASHIFLEEFVEKIHRKNQELLSNSKCRVFPDPCFWVTRMEERVKGDSSSAIHYDDIYFKMGSTTFWISFSGFASDRQYFLEMVESIKVARFASSDWQNEYPVDQPERFVSWAVSLLRKIFPEWVLADL